MVAGIPSFGNRCPETGVGRTKEQAGNGLTSVGGKISAEVCHSCSQHRHPRAMRTHSFNAIAGAQHKTFLNKEAHVQNLLSQRSGEALPQAP